MMKSNNLLFIVVVLFIASVTLLAPIATGKKIKNSAELQMCTGLEVPDSLCLLTIRQLRPTQVPYGRLATKCKQGKFESYAKVEKLTQYLKKHPVPVVIDPSGTEFYMTDHHHMVRAYYDAQFTQFPCTQNPMDRIVVVQVLANKSNKDWTREKFWDWMLKNNYSYAYDNFGKPLTNVLTQMPRNITGLANDPFRSLSYLVRSYGGYGKVENYYFLEFIWANYFRSHTTTPHFSQFETSGTLPWQSEEQKIEQIFKEAMTMAKNAEAKKLPGYGQGEKDLPDCAMWSNL